MSCHLCLAWFQVQETLAGTITKHLLHSARRQQCKWPCLQLEHHPMCTVCIHRDYTIDSIMDAWRHLMYTYLDPDMYERRHNFSLSVLAMNTSDLLRPRTDYCLHCLHFPGCKIKALRAKTNTYIKTPVRGEDPIFVVTGRKEDVAAAKHEILSAAEHFSQIRASRRNNNNGTAAAGSSVPNGPPSPTTPGQVTIQVRVPYRVVGLVVGPKGATIKRIQQQTHTYIVTPSRDKEPIFEVTGMPDSVEKARQEIESHIAARTGGLTETNVNGLNPAMNGISSVSDELHINHVDFRGSGLDPSIHDISDMLGSMYKGSSPSAFTSYNSALNNSNNLLSQQDSNVFTFPTVNGVGSAKLAELSTMANVYGNTTQVVPGSFGLHEADEGIASPNYEPAGLPMTSSIWSDLSGSRSGLAGMSLFAPCSTSSGAMARRNSSGVVTSGPLSPTLTSTTDVLGSDHSMVRRIRSDPINGGLAAMSVFAPLPSFATSNASLSTGSTSTSPTDSTGSSGPRRSCYLCAEGSIVAALVPCGHNLFCMDCANVIMSKTESERQCPVCQQMPTQAIRIFSN